MLRKPLKSRPKVCAWIISSLFHSNIPLLWCMVEKLRKLPHCLNTCGPGPVTGNKRNPWRQDKMQARSSFCFWTVSQLSYQVLLIKPIFCAIRWQQSHICWFKMGVEPWEKNSSRLRSMAGLWRSSWDCGEYKALCSYNTCYALIKAITKTVWRFLLCTQIDQFLNDLII